VCNAGEEERRKGASVYIARVALCWAGPVCGVGLGLCFVGWSVCWAQAGRCATMLVFAMRQGSATHNKQSLSCTKVP
jgi:hypothetical protein